MMESIFEIMFSNISFEPSISVLWIDLSSHFLKDRDKILDCLSTSGAESVEQFYYHSEDFSCDGSGENHYTGNISEIADAFLCGSMDLVVCCVPLNFYSAPFELLEKITTIRSENGHILILWENAYNIKMLKYMFGMEQDLESRAFLPIPITDLSDFINKNIQNLKHTVYSGNQIVNVGDQCLIRTIPSLFPNGLNLTQILSTNYFYVIISNQGEDTINRN